MDDRAEIDQLMTRFLRAVSFEHGGTPAYADLHDLFVDGARLIKSSGETPEISTVEAFIAPRQKLVDDGELTSFEETELDATTELFGNVAHRWCTYAKRGTQSGTEIDTRGAITTQFVRTPAGWRMSSMAWDDERPGLELPRD
jgi:SnoaL-like domain